MLSGARARIPRGSNVSWLQSYSGAMATIKVNVCRFCGNTVLPKLSVALFKNSLIFFSTKDKVSQATPIACHADRPAEFE